jgi:tripartite-type tricarboxylate transporter receptor subunit TctC
VANVDQPYKTLPEFIAHARAHPGKLSYSSPGNGTPQHLAGEVFAKLVKTEMLHVPYRGTGPSISDEAAALADIQKYSDRFKTVLKPAGDEVVVSTAS